MFCSNCGKNLSEEAKFCDGCGAPINVVKVGAEVGNQNTVIAQSSPIFRDFLNVIKGFFSKNTVKTVGDAAKSNGMEWIISASISVLTFALAVAVNAKQIINSLLGAVSGYVGGYIYKFGPLFLFGLIIGAVTYFLMSGTIFGAVKLIFKKNTGFVNVLNLVAAATLPLSCVYIANMLLGFIWTGFIIVLFAAGTVSVAVLLYVGIQKLDKFETSPFWAYNAVWAIVVAVIVIIVSIAVSIAVNNTVNSISNSFSSFF